MNKNNLYILKFSMADYCGDCEDDEERFYDQTSRRHCRLNVSERQMRRRRAAQRHQMSYTIDDLEQPADSSDDLPPPEPQELMLEDLPPPPQELMLEDLPQVMSENDDDDLEDYYSLVEEESATEDELCYEEDENDDDFYMEQFSVEERQNLFKASLVEYINCNVNKTSVNKLVEEAKHLMENSLVYRGRRLPVEILCFSCDQPTL